MKPRTTWLTAVAVAALLTATAAPAAEVTFKDPTGDDHGPGEYIYPTDAVYKRGSFDLTELSVSTKGKRASFAVSFGTGLDDPWRMDTGFSVQMAFIFIDTDGVAGSGFTDGMPGLNISFAEEHAWDKVIILSPQASSRVKQEVEAKVPAALQDAVIVPTRTKGTGQTVTGEVRLSELGEGDPATWGYQVVIQSNEGFPAETDLLTRKVNEFEGQHRFGGGSDYDCDPHVVDVLAGNAEGDESEIAAQHEMLSYECNADGTSKRGAVLTMVRKGAA